MSGPVKYRGWSVHFDHPPIPIRSMDWSATSPDYEVDCDEDGFHVVGGEQVHAATYDELIIEIDAAIPLATDDTSCNKPSGEAVTEKDLPY